MLAAQTVKLKRKDECRRCGKPLPRGRLAWVDVENGFIICCECHGKGVTE